MTLELVQFRHSPYNEKVRWALDLKQVPHVRRRVLPGPHVPAVKKLTGQVHNQGIGIAGIYTYESAEMKVARVTVLARENEYPLMCTLEEDQ